MNVTKFMVNNSVSDFSCVVYCIVKQMENESLNEWIQVDIMLHF